MAEPNDVKSIFLDASEKPLAERNAFLDQATGGDAVLRARVEALLKAHDDPDSFLEDPAAEFGATIDLSPAESPLAERPGTLIGPYKLLEQIGEGGMGVVYMAEQTEPIQRTVALKIIKPGMDTRQVIARFEAERQALAMMDHPNIARVIDAGTTDTSRPYFVMDLVKGVPITEYCDAQHLPVRQRLELMAAVCLAVQHAHQKGIIHRDLKPSNVLVAEYDGKPVPKVIDFGVAKATAQRLTERTMFTQYGQIVGTFEYMSPEQARFNQLDVDTRSDIYSLGVLLYELLAGSTPLEKERLRSAAFDEVLQMINEEEPPRPSLRINSLSHRRRAGVTVPVSAASIAANRAIEPQKLPSLLRGELDWIAMKCLAKERNARYATAMELAADLERWLRDEPLSIRAPDPTYLLRLWIRQNLGGGGWAVAIGLIWGTFLGIACWILMAKLTSWPILSRRLILGCCLYLGAMAGPVTIWLVRPKNRTAEIVTGIISGTLGGILFYTISFGAICVSVMGLPNGIWFGMTFALFMMNFVCIVGTLAAGMLSRRHGTMRAALVPHFELVLPSTVLVLAVTNCLYSLVMNWNWMGFSYYIPVFISLVLAAVSVLVRWRWPVRLVLHAAWITSVYVLATEYWRNAPL